MIADIVHETWFQWTLYFQSALAHFIIQWILRPVLRYFQVASAPYPGDQNVSTEWLTKIFRKDREMAGHGQIVRVNIQDLAENRGYIGGMTRLTVEFRNGNSETFVMKAVRTQTVVDRYNAIMMGQFREGKFYDEFSNEFQGIIPKVYYSFGSSLTGDCLVLMEDLQKVGTGVNHYFGNQIWGARNLSNEENEKPEVLLERIYCSFAKIHAKYWCNSFLMEHSWLKSAAWYRGENKAQWNLSLKTVQRLWAKAKSNQRAIENNWSPKLVSIIDRSLFASTWKALQNDMHNPDTPFTLTHGDFHAANMFSIPTKKRLAVVDWPEIGVGEPLTELGQFMISDVKPDFRRKHEKSLVRKYWKVLTANGVSAEAYPFEKCWNAYVTGCVQRWIYMFVLLANLGLPKEALQYFHDQLLSFIEDHGSHSIYILKTIPCVPDSLFQ